MDILDKVSKDIREVEEKIELVNKSLGSGYIHPGDIKTINSLMSTHRGYVSERTKLTELLHKVTQDINVKNEEIRGRIQKMKAEIELIASSGKGEIAITSVLLKLNDMYNTSTVPLEGGDIDE